MKLLSSLNEYKYTVLISLISVLSIYYGYSYYSYYSYYGSNTDDKIIEIPKKETKSKRNEPRGKRKRSGVRRGAGHT